MNQVTSTIELFPSPRIHVESSQDSFRSLLNRSSTGATSRGSFLPPKKPTHGDANFTEKSARDKAAFKPRKLNGQFRDRAAERREGINDYAEIEGVLEDFEKRNAGADCTTIDEQRQYLGGDAGHSILVKGLDFALLEQNRARAAAEEDANTDAALEAALSGKRASDTETAAPPTPTAKPKRTREDRIADLKRRRDEAQNGSPMPPTPSADVERLERAKKMGKFRPIGTPLPVSTKEDGPEKRKKKKRKLTETQESMVPARHEGAATPKVNLSDPNPVPPPIRAQTPPSPPEPNRAASPPPITRPPVPESNSKNRAADGNDSDEDIFADAGSYKGLGSDAPSDSDEPSDLGEDGREHKKQMDQERRDGEGDAPQIGRWFGDEPNPASLVAPPVRHEGGVSDNKRQRSGSPLAQVSMSHSGRGEEGEEAGSPVPARLQPLSSSLSIAELIEMDKRAEAEEKRKARKAKRKAAAGTGTGEPVEAAPKKKLDRNQKLQRDYQQYTKYAEKNLQGESAK